MTGAASAAEDEVYGVGFGGVSFAPGYPEGFAGSEYGQVIADTAVCAVNRKVQLYHQVGKKRLTLAGRCPVDGLGTPWATKGISDLGERRSSKPQRAGG
jgi:hypothetical protein